MKYTKHNITRKCAEVVQCLNEALDALRNETVIDEVARFALDHPELEWEPVALAAFAVNVKRRLDLAKAAASGAPAMADETPAPKLSLPPSDGPGISLPDAPRLIW